MTDRAEQNGIVFSEIFHTAVGQGLARAFIAFAAKVVLCQIDFKAKLISHGIEHLDRFDCDFRPGAVPGHDCNIITLTHVYPFLDQIVRSFVVC